MIRELISGVWVGDKDDQYDNIYIRVAHKYMR